MPTPNREQYPSDWSPLHIAVWRHDYAQVLILAHRSSVDREDDHGWTPIHLACASESSPLFYSHQVLRRNPTRQDSKWKPGRGRSYSALDDNERVTAMRILEVLLGYKSQHGSQFPTPLHCAASSGWLSHARALVEAGAPVYTGPDCSPLCWVKDGSGGKSSIALYLREMLGERGLAMIEADHERSFAAHNLNRAQQQSSNLEPGTHKIQPDNSFYGSSASPQLPRSDPSRGLTLRGVLPHPGNSKNVRLYGLCEICSAISFKDLVRPRGYLHHHSLEKVRHSSRYCDFCAVINEIFSEGGIYHEHRTSQVIVRASNGTKRHRGTCTDPSILRTLDLKLSAGCTCPSADYSLNALDFAKCFGTCEGFEAHIDIFARKETKLMIPFEFDPQTPPSLDLPWSIQQGVDIDHDPLSPAGLSTMQRWLEVCETKHSNCSSSQTKKSQLPTRVIDVNSPDGQSIRLHKGEGKHGKYLALSHRWVSGPTPQWVTSHDILERRQEWFALEVLPATIIDAVRVTRKLGLQYLWVDSLCIVQDSQEDKQVELPRMSEIYANAYVTLFADCARDDEDGFLHSREPRQSVTVTLPTRDGQSAELHLRKSSLTSFRAVQSSLFSENVEASYISDRAWIFQERILSSRILHFGKDQMFWECSEGTFAEDGHVVLKKGQRECGQREDHFSKLSYGSVLSGLAPLSSESFNTQWKRFVSKYCTLNLTRDEDKLPALSGLAAAFDSRAEGSKYIAGLWERDLPMHLAWSITNTKPERAHRVLLLSSDASYRTEQDHTFVHSSQLFSRPKTYRSPTFSWAAVNGSIEYHDMSESCVQMKAASFDTPASNPYGRPNSGYLEISGLLTRAWSLGPFEKDVSGIDFRPRKKGYIPLYDGGLSFGYLLPDSKEDIGKLEVYCFKLGETKYEEVFLALIPVGEADGEAPRFRRIGLGKTDEKIEIFHEAEVSTIRLI